MNPTLYKYSGLTPSGLLLSLVAFVPFTFGCDKIRGEATIYAPNYSEQSFKGLRHGASRREVLAQLGSPMLVVTQAFSEMWMYRPKDELVGGRPLILSNRWYAAYDPYGDPPFVQFNEDGIASYVSSNYLNQSLVGLTKDQAVQAIGKPNWQRIIPDEIVFHYSEPNRTIGNGTYKRREVHFNSSNIVSLIVSGTSYD